MILMPVWLLWLGHQLTYVKLQPQATALLVHESDNDDTKADDEDDSIFA